MMITQVIKIGLFRRLDRILKLVDEEEKRDKNQEKKKFPDTQPVKAARCNH